MANTAQVSPLVSIGLPVYNGQRFLHESLEALLAQEYEDFEIIISDNASTDGTSDICREFAARDRRITYHRNRENLGARGNFEQVVALASGRYFMWASCHDLWGPAFLARCVEVMEDDPSVVLTFTRAAEVDDEASRLRPLRGEVDTRGLDAAARYRRTVRWITGYAIYGVHRLAALRRVLPIRQSLGPDALILAELPFLGAYAFVDEELFFLRRMSVARNWRRYFSNLQLEYSLWNFGCLYWWFFRDYLNVVARYARYPSERAGLSAATVLILLARTLAWFGGVLVSLVLPKVYRPW